MASKKFQRGGNAIVYSVLAIGIVVMLNIIASRTFGRLDLTQDKVFTISDASKKLVSGLPDRLSIKAFISSDLPPQVRSIARYLRDMLEEYATYSKGKVTWEALDPSKDEKIKEEALRLKVQQARLSVFEKTKASVSESYLGVAFQYGGKVESLPFISDITNLEYQISSTIRRLVGKKKKVGFTSGHGEPNLYQGLAAAKEALKEYEVTTVDLTEGKNPIPADIDVLLMIGPTQPLAERAKYEIDQYLMKGKAMAFWLDGMVLESPRGQMMPGQAAPTLARANNVGLTDQLAYYGIKVNEDLVMDRQNARVVLPAGNQRIVTNYPAFPVVTTLSKDCLITRNLKAFIPIFPASLEITPEVRDGKTGVQATVLASTSAMSWRQTGLFVFDPLHPPVPTKEVGPFNLAYYLQGTFKSFFAGKSVPPAGPAPATPPEKESSPSGTGALSPGSTRMVVVADSDMVKDQFLGLFPGNMMLLLNTVDYLAEDDTLIAIRAKGQTQRPLRQMEDSTITLAKYGNIVGLPLIFIVAGIFRWRWRKIARQRKVQEIIKYKK